MEIVTGQGELNPVDALPLDTVHPGETDDSGDPPASPAGIRMSWAVASDIGLKRAENQDSFLAAPPFFLVADGMGGHAGGKQASATLLAVLDACRGRWLSVEGFRYLLDSACREVMKLADANLDYSLSPPGTTLTGLVLVGGLCSVHEQTGENTEQLPVADLARTLGSPDFLASLAPPGVAVAQCQGSPAAGEVSSRGTCAAGSPELLVINVGDSRTYELTEGRLSQLTRDHSQVAQMLEDGLITPEMVRFMPNRSVITRAVGAGQSAPPKVDSWRLPLGGFHAEATQRRFLVCSDGLHAMISGESIRKILAQSVTPEDAVKTLVEAALAAGGADNVTALVLDIKPAAGEAVSPTGGGGNAMKGGGRETG